MAAGLNTRLATVLRHRPTAADLLVVAGVGWRPGVVGHASLPAGAASPAGYAVETGRPVLSNDLSGERRFEVPELLAEHGAQSALNVVIGPVNGATFGVLEVGSTHRNEFLGDDIAFLQALANVLAAAIARTEAENAKHQALREKDLLMQEVHHRVKNSLQLVHSVLQMQARRADPAARRPLDEAARRIMTIGAVHRRLYAGRSVSQANAAEFLHELLADMRLMMPDPDAMGDVRLVAPYVLLSADATTTLGIVVTELVTNAVKYGARPISVEVADTPEGLLVTVTD
ncbi:MAG: GAF domain-containing protein, partial [Acetobacteraceae bacterium]|nr:GAF domain-containing protein [Acetobacteraceae bacterium]